MPGQLIDGFQLRLIWPTPVAVAVRFVGADGAPPEHVTRRKATICMIHCPELRFAVALQSCAVPAHFVSYRAGAALTHAEGVNCPCPCGKGAACRGPGPPKLGVPCPPGPAGSSGWMPYCWCCWSSCL